MKVKIKMWSLINTKNNKIVKITDHQSLYVVGFDTRKELITALGSIEQLEGHEKIVKIEFEFDYEKTKRRA